MNNELLLVAEQDEAGRVIAVWKRAKEEKIARPMSFNDLNSSDLSGAIYHGASPVDIASFIKRLPKGRKRRDGFFSGVR